MAAGSGARGEESEAAQPMRPMATNCTRVFVQRDFSEGTGVRFLANSMPQSLVGRLDPNQFEQAISELNNLFDEAEAMSGQVCLENCCGCLTAYLLFLCMPTHYEKVLKRVSDHVVDLNEKIFRPNDLLMIDPFERGLRVIEISILNDQDH